MAMVIKEEGCCGISHPLINRLALSLELCLLSVEASKGEKGNR
jgi:hypothetical protein